MRNKNAPGQSDIPVRWRVPGVGRESQFLLKTLAKTHKMSFVLTFVLTFVLPFVLPFVRAASVPKQQRKAASLLFAAFVPEPRFCCTDFCPGGRRFLLPAFVLAAQDFCYRLLSWGPKIFVTDFCPGGQSFCCRLLSWGPKILLLFFVLVKNMSCMAYARNGSWPALQKICTQL